jgi:DNA-binding beta-propeller fold protein YncE
MDRRSFLLAATAAPCALRVQPPSPLAYATADTESSVVVVDLSTGAIRDRIPTRPDPRSVERVGNVAVVTHTAVGAVSVLDGLHVRHVLDGFVEPRYTAAAPGGRYAFVTDSGRADLATIDVLRGVVVDRLKLRLWPRHLSISRDGRTLWIGLGTASPELAVVDVTDPRHPQLAGRVRPPFAAHDVGFSPSGRAWVTAGAAQLIAVYHGTRTLTLQADAPPQHVTFLRGRAFVTSGNDGTLRVYDEATARLLQTTRVPVGSYNVQFAAGRVLTPSLNAGTLCVLDASGRLLERTVVAASSHDACLARG